MKNYTKKEMVDIVKKEGWYSARMMEIIGSAGLIKCKAEYNPNNQFATHITDKTLLNTVKK